MFLGKRYYCLPGEPAAREDNSLLLKMPGDAAFKTASSLSGGEVGNQAMAVWDWLFFCGQHKIHVCEAFFF